MARTAQSARSGEGCQKQSANKKKVKRMKPEEFAADWIADFALFDIKLEKAREPPPDQLDSTRYDADSDFHLRQLELIGEAQKMLRDFSEAAQSGGIVKRDYNSKLIRKNPYVAADSLKRFVIDFLGEWERFKNEGFHGLMHGQSWMKDFARKLNPLLVEGHRMDPSSIRKPRWGVRPRAQRNDDEDGDHMEETFVEKPKRGIPRNIKDDDEDWE